MLVKRIWRECFDDSDDYVDMYFDNVYCDSDAVTLDVDGRIVSSLLLQRYDMSMYNAIVPMGYIAGAATLPNYRRHGYMGRLIEKTLLKSLYRGDTFCSLIPAGNDLFDFYSKFGFGNVFLVECRRLPLWNKVQDVVDFRYHLAVDADEDTLFDAFSRFEYKRNCSVLHSRRDFSNILLDLHVDGGKCMAVYDSNGAIAAICFVVIRNCECNVKDVLGIDSDACDAALCYVRRAYPDYSVKVFLPVDDFMRNPQPHGMLRIVNAVKCMEIVASFCKYWRCVVRISDEILDCNNCIISVENGRCRKMTASCDDCRIDLDVTVGELAEILFGNFSGKTGIPSVRPYMSLMLD